MTEAGGTFRPLRLYRTSRRPASAKGARSVRGSSGQAISCERRKVSGTQEGRRLRCLRSLGQKIGSAEEVFANRDGEPVYVRVRLGVFWTRTVLIPVQFVETDDEGKSLVLK